MNDDVLDDGGMFDMEKPPPVSLSDKFLFPPLSVLDRRSGDWQDRKRKWLSMGMESEVGRDVGLLGMGHRGTDPVSVMLQERTVGNGTSMFDPVLAELAYRWFSPPGGRVLDPFAGGSVRGIVASTLGRWYTGIDLRPEQIEANRAQAHLGSDIAPQWIAHDSRKMPEVLDAGYEADLIFTCPPYADLEVYSDDPADLSTMGYDAFLDAQYDIIATAVDFLRNDRFAVWVTSDVRSKRTGAYRGLVADTIAAFMECGYSLHNDVVMVDPVGTAAIRAERPFRATRKLTRVHQHMLVFLKGDAKAATVACRGDGVELSDEAAS